MCLTIEIKIKVLLVRHIFLIFYYIKEGCYKLMVNYFFLQTKKPTWLILLVELDGSVLEENLIKFSEFNLIIFVARVSSKRQTKRCRPSTGVVQARLSFPRCSGYRSGRRNFRRWKTGTKHPPSSSTGRLVLILIFLFFTTKIAYDFFLFNEPLVLQMLTFRKQWQ